MLLLLTFCRLVYGIAFNISKIPVGMQPLYQKWSENCASYGAQHPHTVAAQTGTFKAYNWSIDNDLERSNFYRNCASCRQFNANEVLESVATGSSCCAIEWPSTANVCLTLQRYSSVFWIGDSLTRQMVYAMYELLLENLQWGKVKGNGDNNGISDGQKKKVPAVQQMYEQCQCDGTYLDSKDLCRLYDYSTMFHLTRPVLNTLCPSHTIDPRSFLFYYRHHSNREDLQSAFKCYNDSRPQFVYLSSIDAGYTLEKLQNEVVEKILSYIDRAKKGCPYDMKYRFVWAGASPTSVEHNKKYPLQRRDRAIDLNAKMKSWLHVSHPEFKILDFFNMTLDDTSHDGLHFQTSTNVKKASVLLRLMDLLL